MYLHGYPCLAKSYRDHVILAFMFTIDQYMAFGISGSDTSTNMVGADVVVTWINDGGPSAVDYYLTDRQQVPIKCYNTCSYIEAVLLFNVIVYSVGVGLGCVLTHCLLVVVVHRMSPW